MARDKVRAFIDALRALEDRDDLETIVSYFGDHSELSNPTDRTPHRGASGARRFWDQYRRTFAEVHSDFRNVIETDDTAVLEWTSRGRGAQGREVRYDGVSIIEFEDGRVRRFRAYFDPTALGSQLMGPRAPRGG